MDKKQSKSMETFIGAEVNEAEWIFEVLGIDLSRYHNTPKFSFTLSKNYFYYCVVVN